MKFFNILLFVILTLTLANAKTINKKENNKLKKSNYKNVKLIKPKQNSKNKSNNNITSDIYIDMLKQFNFGNSTTYVIGHKSPDADTVGSAIAFADLLNKLKIKAKAVVSGSINGETKYFLDHFGIKVPEKLTNAEGKQFVLVDHSNYLQAIDGMKSARVVGIIDHHNVGDVTSNEAIYSRFAPVGAAASIIYLMYNEFNISISKKTAKVMLMSILSDTGNLTKSTTKAIDRKAYEDLKKIAKIKDVDAIYDGMVDAKASYGNMTDEEIFKSDYKEYEINGKTFCAGDINAKGEEAMKEMADRMYNYMEQNYEKLGFDMVFAKVNNISDNENENKGYVFGYGENALEILKTAFGDFDGKYYISKELLSRKTHIIPPITVYLNGGN